MESYPAEVGSRPAEELGETTQRRRLRIRGVVQGVGFRPFIYRLATRLDLKGHVLNVSDGVIVEIEGPKKALDSFLDRLPKELPPLASIEGLAVESQAPLGEPGFTIHHSVAHAGKFALVPPDIATCDECWADFNDPDNRRFRYPFTNCTNCGPRYTIIQDIPYDRPKTTMAAFTMCPECQAEYDDPLNRRFHAQPNACPRCGPALNEPLGSVRQWLKDGLIVAIKGLGGFHLACDAENDAAVRRLRERKRRSDKAFALMTRDLAAAEKIAVLSDADRRALLSPRRPIVLMRRRPASRISSAVAPENNNLGIMLPYTPLHHLLFVDGLSALVMTSGNLTEEPIVSANDEARSRLGALADRFLFHDRDIQTRVDDSVLRTFEGRERLIRRSRGYAPQPIDLGRPMTELLACGGELKNTFCLTKDSYAILSQHIGDLENLETLALFRETLHHMKRFFRVSPKAVAYDLHPGYLSTRFALEQEGLERIGVQHHHAHIASCMAENHVCEKVIGVALDGTGYGTDGKIWGGEFLLCDFAGFERHAHFRYTPMAGGDAAVREPWRIALGYLQQAFGGQAAGLDLPMFRTIPPSRVRLVRAALERGINTVDTSSCGRLFDAVAAIAGLRQEVNYEGQAAIELEMKAAGGIEEGYPFEIESSGPWQIDPRPVIRAVAIDVLAGTETGPIAARFHNTIVEIILEIARRMRAAERINKVCLSGGTFQNVYLLERTVAGLRKAGFEVLLHASVPANDGGLALGQAVVANEVFKR